MKNTVKGYIKLFTNTKNDIIIKTKDNPSIMNYLIHKKEGLYVENLESVLEETKKDLNWKEKIIVRLFYKTFKKISTLVRVDIVNSFIK